MWLDKNGLLKLTPKEQRSLERGGSKADKLRAYGEWLLKNSKTAKRHSRTHGVRFYSPAQLAR